MKYDAITLTTFSFFSLLSGKCVCTQPTETEEVKKRFDDMFAILKEEDPEAELVMSSQPTYYLGYDDEKWPFATTRDGVTDFLRDVISAHLVFDEDTELPFQTMTMLLANEKVNEKYALGKVPQKLVLQSYLPF